MITIGEIRTAKELKLVGSHKRIWLACQCCGNERWTLYYVNKASNKYCKGCSQKIGGKQKLPRGQYKISPGKLVKGICHICGGEYPATVQYFKRNKQTKNGLNLGRCRKCLNKIRHREENLTLQSRMNRRLSTYIYQALRGEKAGNHWESLVGWNVKALIKHLQKQFTLGMSWDNYGEWHIDHIIPQSVFHFTSPDDIDFKRCWALSNLQPLWSEDNVLKSDKILKLFQPSLNLQNQNTKGRSKVSSKEYVIIRSSMVRKVKRKYARKVTPETPPDAPESSTEPIKAISSGKIPVTEVDMLPPSLKMQLDAMTKLRARHHIPDNLKERTEAMVRRFRGY